MCPLQGRGYEMGIAFTQGRAHVLGYDVLRAFLFYNVRSYLHFFNLCQKFGEIKMISYLCSQK